MSSTLTSHLFHKLLYIVYYVLLAVQKNTLGLSSFHMLLNDVMHTTGVPREFVWRKSFRSEAQKKKKNPTSNADDERRCSFFILSAQRWILWKNEKLFRLCYASTPLPSRNTSFNDNNLT